MKNISIKCRKTKFQEKNVFKLKTCFESKLLTHNLKNNTNKTGQHFRLGPKGPTVAAEECSPLQEVDIIIWI